MAMRLQITLSQELYDTIRRLAAYERRPMSKVITDLFVEVGPVLESTVAALDQVQEAKGGPAVCVINLVLEASEASLGSSDR